MAKYILLTEVKTRAEDAEWWDEQTDNEEAVKVFDSFETAKAEMRKTVKRVLKKCDFAPFENGEYRPLRNFCEKNPHFAPVGDGKYELIIGYGDEEKKGIRTLREIIRKVVSNPDYFCEDTHLDVKDTDDANCQFAFVGNKDFILADCENYGKTLKMNIHNMTDGAKSYYFIYEDADDGRVVNAISVRLLTDAKKSKPAERPKGYETVTFGHYMQDKGGKTESPLNWRVLDKKDGMTLMITENVIDNLVFSAQRDNEWENSALRDWLNGEFIMTAFDGEEQKKIANVGTNDKIFLLSLDDYKKYFSNPKDARAGYTDYARQRTSEYFQTNVREPYAFWWLRTASGDCLCHVCSDGQINWCMSADSPDGVRPAIWVKTGSSVFPSENENARRQTP